MRTFVFLAGIFGLSTTGFAAGFLSPAPIEHSKSSEYSLEMSHVIDYVDYRGSGCQSGEMDWDVSHDSRYLTFRYYDLGVSASSGRSDWSHCNVNVSISLPQGYRVAVQSVSMQGFASVSDPQSTASVEIATGFDQNRPVTMTQRRQPGFFQEAINFSDTLAWRDIQWSPCGRYNSRHTLQFQSQLEVRTSWNGQAEMSGSPRTGSMDQTYTLLWERCDDPQPPREWYGTCRVELETLWGDNISDFWGQSQASSYSQAVRIARLNGIDQCERARGANQLMQCRVDERQCTAIR